MFYVPTRLQIEFLLSHKLRGGPDWRHIKNTPNDVQGKKQLFTLHGIDLKVLSNTRELTRTNRHRRMNTSSYSILFNKIIPNSVKEKQKIHHVTQFSKTKIVFSQYERVDEGFLTLHTSSFSLCANVLAIHTHIYIQNSGVM